MKLSSTITATYRRVRRWVFRRCICDTSPRLAAWLVARAARPWPADAPLSRGRAETGKVTILALTPQMFRGDLDILSRSGAADIVTLPYLWQRGLFNAFYSPDTRTQMVQLPENWPQTAREQQVYHRFLRRFLPALFERLHVDLVLGANIRFEPDIDIGAVAHECGYPYVVQHRENLLASPSIYNSVRDRHRSWGRFKGTHIAVQNAIGRRNFIESGFVDADDISVRGCLRMDGLVRRAMAGGPAGELPKRIALFSFITTQSSIRYPIEVFIDTHVALLRFAKAHPDVEVVIKPKAEHVEKSGWNDFMAQALEAEGLSLDELPNVTVRTDIDAHDLILTSRLVLGINSTTVLEAGIFDMPVIIPAFSYIRTEEYRERTRFVEHLHMFDVPDDREDLVRLLERRYAEPAVDREKLRQRRALFDDLISSLDGDALEQHVALFRDLLENRQTGGAAALDGSQRSAAQ